jgi:hypothetical protein
MTGNKEKGGIRLTTEKASFEEYGTEELKDASTRPRIQPTGGILDSVVEGGWRKMLLLSLRVPLVGR